MITADTIAAISSAAGAAPRMILRISGPGAHSIASALCDSPPAGPSRTRLSFRGVQIPAWVYVFTAPHSYTGQNLVEFHIPGNPLLASMLLDDLIARGCRQADPGEFTARAYFAGRMDLAEAEGVAAAIAAANQQELRAARQLMTGQLARQLNPILDALAQTLALIEVGIDFSEEDITILSDEELHRRIDRIDADLQSLLDQSARFDKLSHEPRAVLVGRPNAGKSTLLNALAGRDRAVVSPHAGTTRDVLSAEVALRRGLIHLVDVAGLEPAASAGTDSISAQMRQRALVELERADVVLLVHDLADNRPPLELPRRPDLVIHTKCDLISRPDAPPVAVSAASGQNLDILRDRLDQLCFGPETSAGASLALNARHLRAIAAAREALRRAAHQRAQELIALELHESLDSLGQILGVVTPDDLLGKIFSTFCIGK